MASTNIQIQAVLYGCEIWFLTLEKCGLRVTEKMLRIFGENIKRAIK
jgi:hypothetical protein